MNDIEDARSTIKNASLLVCQLEIPLEINLAAMRVAREEGDAMPLVHISFS